MANKITDSATLKSVAEQLMDKLGISKLYVLDFMCNNQVYLYDNGEARRIDPGSELYVKLRKLETRGGKVYAVTHDYLPEVGEMFSYLYVSPYPEDWNHMVRRSGNLLSSDNLFMAYAYVRNVANDLCSEFGYVALQVENGELRRVG